MDYKNKYEQALERARIWKDKSGMPKDKQGILDDIFPELGESEDERIKKDCIKYLDWEYQHCPLDEDRMKIEKCITWLEKQGEQKPIDKIQIGKKYKCIASPRYSMFVKDLIYRPEDKFLCSLMNFCSDCFEPIEDDEQKPAFEMITPEESLGVDSDTYNKIVDECVYGEQKPTDKVEPRFKVGDWITNGFDTKKIIGIELKNEDYLFENGISDISLADNISHLWTIQDAKDGDVLCTYECDKPKIVFILRGTPKKHYALSYHCYYNIMYPNFESDSVKGCLAPNDEDVKPATKEQRDLLFQKMHEAGYEWDADTKKMNKIEQKPAWSEQEIENCAREAEDNNCIILAKHIRQLKSLRPQSTWKPSDEQMDAIDYVKNFDYGGYKDMLVSLYYDLKKLKDE